MAKNLVIVESPAKAKTINKILGKDYEVMASMGHVRDLPQRTLGVDLENGFQPEYVTISTRKKVLTELKAAAKKADAVYLAPDPDREGEAIAWHLQIALAKSVPEDRFYRVTYNEITAPAIRAAFEHPGRLDMARVDAQQARRVLDRIVGYQVSPLLWRRIRGSKSAGRVQSVALRLVCERERQILDFVPEEYWLMGARVRKLSDPRDPFEIRLARIGDDKAQIHGQDEVASVRADLDGRTLTVSAIVERELTRKPQAPFITSTLQQAGSSAFGLSPSRTMRLAQTLYEGVDFGDGPVGLITYMRTDSVAVAKGAQDACREYVRSQYGEEYVPPKPAVYTSRGSAQEAHESIRPTDMNLTPETLASVLKPEELKLYRLIWSRFVASQMAPARIAQRTVEIEARATDAEARNYLFRATTSEIAFPGYMKATGADTKKKGNDAGGESDEVEGLPPLAEGETLDCLEWLQEQKFTQPPPRFTEASLVRALEENGVGRPSTFAQVLSTILAREYVAKDKRALAPTELGLKVNDFLVENLNELFDIKFTAQMEESLDEIERGHIQWTGMLESFYASFQEWIRQTRGVAANPEAIQALLDLLAPVTEWEPPTKRGNRTYSDERFVESMHKQRADAKKPVSVRQVEALVKLAAKYRAQLPDDPAPVMEHYGLGDAYRTATAPPEPPRECTHRKLDLLSKVDFQEPRTSGKRVYDDAKFADSLRQQVQSGKRLSENQLHYLNRLVTKYGDQIENFDEVAKDFGLDAFSAGPDTESGPLLDLLGAVQDWKPAVLRGKREWDDRKFFESLRAQFEQKKSLSDKQRASLKKMCGRYADQIDGYDKLIEELGLPPRKQASKKKAANASEAEG